MLACIALFVPTHSFSQGTFSGHLGLAIPSSSFADYNINNSDKIGAAALGLNLGIKYDYPLLENGIGLFGELNLNYNGLQKGFRREYDKGNATNISYPQYLNIPISGGLSYTYSISDKVTLFSKGGLVFNFLKKTDFHNGADATYKSDPTYKFDMSTHLGYTLGVGAWLNSKIEFAITYLGLGEHQVNYEYNNGHNISYAHIKQDVGLITLTVGYKF